MQKEFTKADLKDGMVIYFDDGTKGVFVNHSYTTNSDIEFFNGELALKQSRRKIIKIEYGEKVVYESETTRMTAEEMRVKLEELTGEKIEIEPSREEMVGACYVHCENSSCVRNCILMNSGNCVFRKYSDEQLKEAYKKVIADGKE